MSPARAAARRRQGRSPFAIGLIAIVAILAFTYLGFTKHIPFTRGYQVNAVFESANGLRPNSPVRIAGVNVGKVKKIDAQDGTDNAVVTMEITDQGRPISTDASAKIRPRIFLEGNFFVDLKPGTPGSPELDDGGTLKVTQTATPVQLDQVLSSLQGDTRQDLRDVLDGLGTALQSQPNAAENRDADPSARGETAAQSLNDAYDDAGPAAKAQAIVNEAFLGIQPDEDLGRLISGLGRTAAGLARNEGQLQGLVSNFNTTVAALASEQGNLKASIHELAPTLEAANRAFASLNDAFPPTRAFAREILPGVRETAATIDASFPWVKQARGLFSEEELQGLARDLAPTTRDLAKLTNTSIELLPQTDLVSKCVRDVILPTGDVKIQDEFSTGTENYKEFWYAMVGLAGEGQNFDGNGMYVRFQTGGGSQQVSLGQSNIGTGPQFANLPTPPIGNRPAYPGKQPPLRDDQPCYKQKLPDLNGPAAAMSAPLQNGAQPTSRKLQTLRTKLRPFGSKEAGGK
jgi:phospholipid/cholesterol/gamma-HCH transport system substrate-binding protein